jgi:hypothetical protein
MKGDMIVISAFSVEMIFMHFIIAHGNEAPQGGVNHPNEGR